MRKFLAAIIAACVAPSGVLAQRCGWESPDMSIEPPSLVALYARASAGDADIIAEVRPQLREWFATCDDTPARRAILTLRAATSRSASDLVTALHGAALARGPDVQHKRVPGYLYRVTKNFSNSERDARRALGSVVRRTGWPEPALELAALAIGTRHEDTLKEAADALKTVTAKHPQDAALWRARAEVALARRDERDALAAATQAAALGDGAGTRALGVIRLLGGNRDEGARNYLEGLKHTDALATTRYFEDLRPLLTPEEHEQWQALEDDAARAEWMRRKWEWRASVASRSVAERLQLHHQRIEIALQRYRRYGANRAMDQLWLDTFSMALPFDDRGLLFIRHGEPDDVVRATSLANRTREAWIYNSLSGGAGVFEFMRDISVDYALVKPLQCDTKPYAEGMGGRNVLTTRSGDPGWMREFERDFLSYATDVGMYNPSLGASALACLAWVKGGSAGDVVERQQMNNRLAQVRADEALRTEDATPPVTKPLRLTTTTYAFAGPGRATELFAFLGIGGDDVAAQHAGPPSRYGLNITMAVEDAATERVSRTDTTVTFTTPAPLAPDALVRAAMTMRADPTLAATVRITVRNAAEDGQWQAVLARRAIPDFREYRLALSDLVVADETGTRWRREGIALAPLAGHVVASHGRFRLFYEAYGARSGDVLRTEITIAPGRPADLGDRLRSLIERREGFTVSFDALAQPDPDGAVREVRDIASGLEPGLYDINVSVTNERTGERAVSTTSLRIAAGG